MNESLMDVLLSVSRNVAINKESNVPGKNHLDKKKQVPLLYSTMLRKMYLKCPLDQSPMEPPLSSRVVEVSKVLDEVKISERDNLSQRSLPVRSKNRDKDCSCM